MWLLYTWVHHFDKNISVISEFNHQLLSFLHVSELIFVYQMCIVEEEIILRCDFYLNVFNLVLVTLYESKYKLINRLTLTNCIIFTLMASRVPTSWGPLFGSYILSSNGASLSKITMCPSASDGSISSMAEKSNALRTDCWLKSYYPIFLSSRKREPEFIFKKVFWNLIIQKECICQ